MTIDRAGRNEFINAVIDGKSDRVTELIKSGVDLNFTDNAGWTALHFCCQSDYYEIAQWLLSAGAAVDPQDKYGNTPLFRAVFNARGNDRMIKLLLSYGADRHLKNFHGNSPWNLAEKISNYDLKPFFD